MTLALDALIKKTTEALATETDATRKAELTASLEAYKKTKHSIEKHETEEGEDDEEDEEDEDDAAAKGNETDRSDDPDEDEDDGEEDDKKAAAPPMKKDAKAKGKKSAKSEEDASEAESEGDEAEALVALVRRATGGKKGPAAMGALEGLLSKARQTDKLAARLDALEQRSKAEARDSVVRTALAANRITKKEAAGLFKKPIAHVEAFLEARPRGLVYSQSEDLPVPAMQNPDGSTVLPPELDAIIKQAVAASEGKVTREQFVKDYQAANGLNGSGLNGRGGQV